MKILKMHRAIAATVMLFATPAAYADMAGGSYTYNSSNMPIWDLSGTYSGNLGSLSTSFTINQDSSGNFQGNGTFGYVDSGLGISVSGNAAISGKETGTPSDPSISITLLLTGSGTAEGRIVNMTGAARAKFGIDVQNAQLSSYGGKISAILTDVSSGKKKGGSLPVEKGEVSALPSSVNGSWTLALNLTPSGTKYTGSATIQTSSGATVQYTVIGTYSSKTDTSKLKFISKSGALSLVISTSGPSMSIVSMKGKLYGQSLNFKGT